MNPRRHKGSAPGHTKPARFGRWRSARTFALLAVGATVAGCTAPMSDAPTSGGGADAAPVSANGYVRLERGAHPLARPEFDLGPLDPNRRLTNLSGRFWFVLRRHFQRFPSTHAAKYDCTDFAICSESSKPWGPYGGSTKAPLAPSRDSSPDGRAPRFVPRQASHRAKAAWGGRISIVVFLILGIVARGMAGGARFRL